MSSVEQFDNDRGASDADNRDRFQSNLLQSAYNTWQTRNELRLEKATADNTLAASGFPEVALADPQRRSFISGERGADRPSERLTLDAANGYVGGMNRILYPDNRYTSFERNENGDVFRLTNRQGEVWERDPENAEQWYQLDTDGERMGEPISGNFAFDNEGNYKFTAPNGYSWTDIADGTRVTTDSEGRVTRFDYPDGAIREFERDTDSGQVTSFSELNGSIWRQAENGSWNEFGEDGELTGRSREISEIEADRDGTFKLTQPDGTTDYYNSDGSRVRNAPAQGYIEVSYPAQPGQENSYRRFHYDSRGNMSAVEEGETVWLRDGKHGNWLAYDRQGEPLDIPPLKRLDVDHLGTTTSVNLDDQIVRTYSDGSRITFNANEQVTEIKYAARQNEDGEFVQPTRQFVRDHETGALTEFIEDNGTSWRKSQHGNWREFDPSGNATGRAVLEPPAPPPISPPWTPSDNAAAPARGDYVFPVAGYRGRVERHWGQASGGSDIFAPVGTPVYAMRGGTVLAAGSGDRSAGNWVHIRGTDGNQFVYLHLHAPPLVARGQNVETGQQIGLVGRSGSAMRAHPNARPGEIQMGHLHFGMGREIQWGTGPYGAVGRSFDAVTLLNQVNGNR